MKQVERIIHYPELYGQAFEDVVAHYAERDEGDFTWGYGKNDRYRVGIERSSGLVLQLDSINYDGDWTPIYTPVYRVEESSDGTSVHSSYEPERGTVPYDAFTVPELVLRGILHLAQDSVRLRARNGLK